MANILVLFQADHETTEQLALAVAVGAVEAAGSIRLRRLTRPDAPEVGHKGYGVLKAADLEWAETVVVGLESAEVAEAELGPLLVLLNDAEDGRLTGKRVWTFHPAFPGEAFTASQVAVLEAASVAGLVLLDLPLDLAETTEERVAVAKTAGRLCAA